MHAVRKSSVRLTDKRPCCVRGGAGVRATTLLVRTLLVYFWKRRGGGGQLLTGHRFVALALLCAVEVGSGGVFGKWLPRYRKCTCRAPTPLVEEREGVHVFCLVLSCVVSLTCLLQSERPLIAGSSLARTAQNCFCCFGASGVASDRPAVELSSDTPVSCCCGLTIGQCSCRVSDASVVYCCCRASGASTRLLLSVVASLR